MLLKKIESLRKQPKHIRNRYAFGFAASVSLLVMLFWGVSLPNRLSEQSLNDNANLIESEKISETFSDLSGYVSESIGNLKMQAELLETNSPSTLGAEDQKMEVNDVETTSGSSSSTAATGRGEEGNVVLIEGRPSATNSVPTTTQ